MYESGAASQLLFTSWISLDRLWTAAGLAVSSVSDLALALGCSEYRAYQLAGQGRLLASLPGAFDALSGGLLTVEQTQTLLGQLEPLGPADRLAVWKALLPRLQVAADSGGPLPPARLSELVRRLVARVDPGGVARRRRVAQAAASVDYRRRDDGLVDLFALGITGPNAQACLASIAARADPLGPEDTRPAGQRRLDALVDLLCGRDLLPRLHPRSGPSGAADAGCSGGLRGCGCPSGAGVPCGAQVYVHVQLGATLGVTDEPAELVGHGPLDPEQLAELLLAAPQMRTVWVDEHGTPLALSDRTRSPGRHDPADLRRQLLAMAVEPPPPPEQWHPRHPNDHHRPPEAPDVQAEAGTAAVPEPGPAAGPEPGPTARAEPKPAARPEPRAAGPPETGHAAGPEPGPASSPAASPKTGPPAADPAPFAAAGPLMAAGNVTPTAARPDDAVLRALASVGGWPHPAGRGGGYRVPSRLRRLLTVRSPRCEWPGCGARAIHCDQDHDRRWPDGPTCACNLGPACRRHHRVKQTGFTKTRRAGGLTWTGPTGRSWHSPSPHQAPAPPVRALPPVPVPGWLDDLTPLQREDALLAEDHGSSYFDGSEDSDRCDDTEPPDDHDRLSRRIRSGDTQWTLDLQDLQNWLPAEANEFLTDRDLTDRRPANRDLAARA